jgi:integrase
MNLRPGVAISTGRKFMPEKLSQAFAEALKPINHTFIRYGSPPGFGVRVTPTGARSWIFDYRPGGGRRAAMRRLTLGKVEALPFAKARRRAEDLFHRTRLGEDPAAVRDDKRAAPTLEAVAARFMAEEIRPARKPATARYYDNLLRIHILPTLGNKRAREIAHSDVAKLHRAIGAGGKQITANRAIELVSSLYGWAGKAGEVSRDMNPARDVSRFREQARTRYLSDDELARLGAALELGETAGLPLPVSSSKHARKPENQRAKISPYAAGAIRLLALTGCRLGEVLNLKWSEVDLERGLIHLEDSKTGARPVWLNAAALAVLAELENIRVGAYVIAGERPDVPRKDLNRPWRQVLKHAGLEGVSLHTLRHTHASVGVGAGIGLPLVGALLGHKVASTTLRYAHVGNIPARRASETIGAAIAAAMERRPGAPVVPLRGGKRS